ncbi:efflux RND transporter periplasmic adaptor subunit [Paracoccus sp. 12-3]|nr:efflux RND transporter periplasmic adaptor subunit [Paracoccus xiamenensis]
MHEKPKARRRQWLWLAISVVILIGVVLVLLDIDDTVDVQPAVQMPPPVVSVITVAPQTVQAEVSAFAEVRPRWDAELRASVTGRILTVHDAALAGTRVSRGDPLFSIEKSQYESAVASAEMELAQAQLELLRAGNDVRVARKQFEREGRKPPAELAIRLPQLRVAEKAVAVAQARLKAARQELAETEVTAPFSGFVVKRSASLGQSVSAGEPLAQLADDRQFELIVEISQADWELLEQPLTDRTAKLYHPDGRSLGEATIRGGGGFLNPKTRQIRLFLDVAGPRGRILSGDLLRVVIPGRSIANTLTLPESVLTREGFVWLVDEGNLLQRISPKILFRADGTLTIASPDGAASLRVARNPLAYFLPGQAVTPQEVGG